MIEIEELENCKKCPVVVFYYIQRREEEQNIQESKN